MSALYSAFVGFAFIFLILAIWFEHRVESEFIKSRRLGRVKSMYQDKPFDFVSAERRVEELQALYWRCGQVVGSEGTWDWQLLQWIDQTVDEIEAAKKYGSPGRPPYLKLRKYL